MKHIAITLSGTDAGRSGLSTYIRQVVPRLAGAVTAAGGRVVAFGTRADHAAYADVLAGVEPVVLPDVLDRPVTSAAWHLTRLGSAAKRVGADVLLLPAANRRCTARAPLPTVAVVHDLASLHVASKFDRWRMVYTTRVIPWALGTVDRVVAISQATRADVLAHTRADPDRLEVVRNGVEGTRFAAAAADPAARARARAAIGIDGPYLLYLARLEHPGKNHLRLLEAFAASVQARATLVLAGADWGAGAQIQAEIARLGLGRRVRVLGFVDGALVPGLVAEADAVMMVGLHEGFGLPALEALAAGRPVAAAATGALPEVVGELGALCDPFDVASMQRALTSCLDDHDLRRRAAALGPSLAAAQTWERTAEGLLRACVAVAA